jgi:hypothetical protein
MEPHPHDYSPLALFLVTGRLDCKIHYVVADRGERVCLGDCD